MSSEGILEVGETGTSLETEAKPIEREIQVLSLGYSPD